jgi:heme A synthase
MAETNDTQQLPRMKRWVIVVCALISIPAAVVLEAATGFRTLGSRLMHYWFPPRDLEDFGRSLWLSFTFDSIICFVALAGVYWLVYPFIGRRK